MKYEYTSLYIINYVYIYIYIYKKLVRQGWPMLLPYLPGRDHSRNITTLKLRPYTTIIDELGEHFVDRLETMPKNVGPSPFH